MIRHLLRLLWQRRGEHRLLVAQMAGTFVVIALLVPPGFEALRQRRRPLGFDPLELVSVSVGLPARTADPAAATEGAVSPPASPLAIAELVRGMRWVQSAALSSVTPFASASPAFFHTSGADGVWALQVEASPELIDVLWFSLMAGDWLDRAACSGELFQAVIDRQMAEQRGGVERAIGARLGRGEMTFTVVGVVEPVLYAGHWRAAWPVVFTPFGPGAGGCRAERSAELVVRTALGRERDVRQLLLSRLAAAFPGRPVEATVLRESATPFTPVGGVLGLVGCALTLLAAASLSGAIWLGIRRRTAELGLRRAVGATARALRRQVLLEMGLLAAKAGLLGIVIVAHLMFFTPGLLGAASPTLGERGRSVAIFLSMSPLAFLALLLIVLGASWLPSRLALRISPREALGDD